MDIEIVLIVSLSIQFIGAIRSLFLIRVTGFKYAWVFLSLAFIFMGIRRSLTLFRVLGGEAVLVDYENEVLGLILSTCILVGVIGIGPIFREWRVSRDRVKALLEEKELLLKEVHHRLKNNMSTVASLLRLQAGSSAEPAVADALGDAERRIMGMSVLYDKIYREEKYESIPAAEYLTALVDEIVGSFPDGGSIRIEREIGEFRVDFRTIHDIGIIVNELITNAMKYAFSEGAEGTLRIAAGEADGGMTVSVQDDGRGLGPDCGTGGFGLTLVGSLIEGLDGTLRIESEPGRGTKVSFSVPRSGHR